MLSMFSHVIITDVEHFFFHLCWPSVCLLWGNVYSGLLPHFSVGLFLVFFVLFCFVFCCWVVWVVCIFWILSPCHLHHLKLFSPFLSIVFLFSLFFFSFAVHVIMLISSHWLIFVFISIALGDWLKKTFAWLVSENVLPMFSSRIFIVSSLMLLFKPFWVYFCAWCESVF